MKKRYPCVETTIDLEHGPFTVRLWIDQGGEIPSARYANEVWLVPQLKEACEAGRSTEDVVRVLAELPHVTAVQVIERHGTVKFGTVVYTVPFEDVRG